MFDQLKWPHIAAGGLGVLALTAAAALTAVQPATAADASATGLQLDTANRVLTVSPANAAYPGDGPGSGDYEQALADALGISVDELEAAYEDAWSAALAQAVEDGELTQEQADALESRGLAFSHHSLIGHAGNSDMDALLADALGISVEDLDAARIEARSTLIEQAVEDGLLTEEEASLMQAREAMQPYLQEAMAQAYANAIQQAVEDGAITQEQADQLLEQSTNVGPHSFFEGRGGHHGARGGRGMLPGDGGSSSGTDDSGGVRGGFFNSVTGRQA